MNMTFLDFRRAATSAGVESITFTAGRNRLIVLRGNSIEVTHSWSDDADDEEFTDACTRALREFGKVRLGWQLRNQKQEGLA